MKNKNSLQNYKIAFIDQKGNIGGGSKFANQLLSNFEKYHQNIEIDYYGSLNSIEKFKISKKKLNNIRIKELGSLKLRDKGIFSLKYSGKIFRHLQDKFFKNNDYINYYLTGNLNKELEKKLRNYDIIFFLWPYLIDLPKVKVKKAIILHDFMFKYYFGGAGSFNLNEIEKQNQYLDKWVKNSEIILTSNFMKSEFKKFYPNISEKKIHLIRVGPLTENIKNSNKIDILKRFKIDSKFILCPTVDKPHKNIFNILRAFYLVKKKYSKLKLVFCGAGTSIMNGKSLPNSIEISNKKKDIFGLGFVTDEELNYLIKESEFTINTSIYDAGNGSGLDAWQVGSPVVMSNIPSFKEHLNFLKVKAIMFDPNNYFDISKKMIHTLKLSNRKKNQMILISKKNIGKYDWKKVVNNYYNLIKNLLKNE
tara:strand:- start:38 stop:1300 length:1263 start_codon:yes stop_codon:yes gene_type:complete